MCRLFGLAIASDDWRQILMHTLILESWIFPVILNLPSNVTLLATQIQHCFAMLECCLKTVFFLSSFTNWHFNWLSSTLVMNPSIRPSMCSYRIHTDFSEMGVEELYLQVLVEKQCSQAPIFHRTTHSLNHWNKQMKSCYSGRRGMLTWTEWRKIWHEEIRYIVRASGSRAKMWIKPPEWACCSLHPTQSLHYMQLVGWEMWFVSAGGQTASFFSFFKEMRGSPLTGKMDCLHTAKSHKRTSAVRSVSLHHSFLLLQ